MSEIETEKEAKKWCQTKVWLNLSTGKKSAFNCKSWQCPRCGPKLRQKWIEILDESVIPRFEHVRFITLTNVGETPDIARENFKQLVKEIRRADMEFYYFKVHETGEKTGMSHFHLLQCGDFIPQKWLSRKAASNNMGKVVHIEQIKLEEAVFYYVTKYMTKLSGDWEGRKITYSRGETGFFGGKTTSEIWKGILERRFGPVKNDPLALIDGETGEPARTVSNDTLERYRLFCMRQGDPFYGDAIEK